MKKYIAEFIGTMLLIVVGCGTAMLVGVDVAGGGYLLTCVAFGLVVTGLIYCIGNISGCHINPAVSIAVLISGGMDVKDFIGYVVAQCVGAVAGAGILGLIFNLGGVADATGVGGFACNGLAGVNGSSIAGLLVEIVFTFLFVMVILGATSKKAGHGSHAGVAIGLVLIAICAASINLTGTSVNPARSIGPAIMAAIYGNTAPISCIWVFIVAPLVGGALAALVYNFMESEE